MKIRVLGTYYTINLYSIPENQYDIGECNPTTKQIKILNSLSKEQKDSTLLHEIIHAVFTETRADTKISAKAEEKICRLIEKLFIKKLKIDIDPKIWKKIKHE